MPITPHATWDRVLTLAAGQHHLIGSAQLRDVLHPRQIVAEVRSGRLHRLWQGMYSVEPWPADGYLPATTRVRAAEMTLRRPVAACWDTAAEIYGYGPPVAETHVLATGSSISTRSGLVLHRHRPVAAPVVVDGVLVADAAECAARLAARMAAGGGSPAALLALLDAALRSGAVADVATLRDRALKLTCQGVALLCKTVPAADGSARDADDSWIRWACYERDWDVPEIAALADTGGALPGADAQRVPDYIWWRYWVSASLADSGASELHGNSVWEQSSGTTDWTHLVLQRVPPPWRTSNGCPIHPMSWSRLTSALSRGRRELLFGSGFGPGRRSTRASEDRPAPLFRQPRRTRPLPSCPVPSLPVPPLPVPPSTPPARPE